MLLEIDPALETVEERLAPFPRCDGMHRAVVCGRTRPRQWRPVVAPGGCGERCHAGLAGIACADTLPYEPLSGPLLCIWEGISALDAPRYIRDEIGSDGSIRDEIACAVKPLIAYAVRRSALAPGGCGRAGCVGQPPGFEARDVDLRPSASRQVCKSHDGSAWLLNCCSSIPSP